MQQHWSVQHTIVTWNNCYIFLLISCKPQLRSWTSICRQKADELLFLIIYLPNGNLMKFTQKPLKTFLCWQPAWKSNYENWEQKPPKTSPSLFRTWILYLQYQWLDQLHASPQIAAPTVHVLSHSYHANSLLVTISYPTFTPNYVLMDWSPNPTTCIILGPIQSTIPNCIHIQLVTLP